MTISVLIVDDQALVRGGFRAILGVEPDISVVGEAGDGVAAVDLARMHRPDVVLMDIRMPRLDGIDATRRIVSVPDRPPRVLVLTTFDLDDYVFEALRAGASGFLLKDVPPEQLAPAIRVVAAGDALLGPTITRRMIEAFVSMPVPGKTPKALDELTARELEVLAWVARGRSNSEIAAELVVAESTIKTHVSHVLDKLQLRDRIHAVVFAYESGLVRPGSSTGARQER